MIRARCTLNIRQYNNNFEVLKRFCSVNSTKKSEYVCSESEFKSAKAYKTIPKLSIYQMVKENLPGGKFHGKSTGQFIQQLKDDCGNIAKLPAFLGNDEIVLISDPHDIALVFRTEGNRPYRRPLATFEYYRKNIRPDVYSEYGGILNEQGETWYKMRTIGNPIMLQPRTVQLYIPVIDETSTDFMKLLQNDRNANNVTQNFLEYVNLWSLESISSIVFEGGLGLLDKNTKDERAEGFIKSIRKFFEMTVEFEIQPSIWRYYKTKRFGELMKTYDDMTNHILYYTDQAVERLKSKPVLKDHEQGVLQKLLNVNKSVALIMAGDLVAAGVDTTSLGATVVLHCLAKNPDKQEKLRQELMGILPEKDSPFTAERMKHIPYLRAVIKEALRMYPPISAHIRKTGQDLVLQGYQVPKGTHVLTGNGILHYESFSRSHEFLPERWIKDDVKRGDCPHMSEAHPFSYLPFGFGPRMCLGMRFAELEIEIAISRIIRNYRVEWLGEDLKFKTAITNIPDGNVNFKMIEL